MKALKINAANSAAIEIALAEVNGRSVAHTYTSASDIEALAKIGENRGLLLLGAKKNLPGAKLAATSGDCVSNSYAKQARSRNATHVVLERRSSGWFLVSINATHVYQDGGGAYLSLTLAQDTIACAVLRKQYLIRAE